MDHKEIVKKIGSEVKSQGAFDEFRKDSNADVDTKPAYQNLQQRVETNVQQFLSKEEWTPDINKIHLRERLRRHLMESGFLDKGVERIVDQVMIPRIPTVIQPKIQEIAYKMLDLPVPKRSHQPPPPPPMMHQLPPLPHSNPGLTLDTNIMNLLPTDLEQVSPDSDKATELSESKDEAQDMDLDDDESPPFEPLGKCASPSPPKYSPMRPFRTQAENTSSQNINDVANVWTETQDTALSAITNEEASRSMDAVASDSQVSTVSRGFAEKSAQAKMSEHAAVNISEEAQMPKFSDNPTGLNADQEISELHFDIKKDEIKFEGTERKNNRHDGEVAEKKSDEQSPGKNFNKAAKNSSFQFNINAANKHSPVGESSLGSLDDTGSTQMKTGYKTKSEKGDILDKTASNSSQSSRYKKHSKHKHRSQEKDRHRSTHRDRSKHDDKQREKDKDRDQQRERDRERERKKEKDRSGRSKHTSSSSKQSTSSSKQLPAVQNKEEKNAASRKLAYSSSNSSSRSEGQDKKRDQSDRKQRKRKASTSSRDYSENSSSKNAKSKADAVRDDHNEKKEKSFRRKSRDSKDKDKSPSQGATRSTLKSSSASSKSKSRHESSSQSSKTFPSNDAPKDNVNSQSVKNQLINVVVLNDILQNPSTACIELEANATGNCVQIVRRTPEIHENHYERISSDNDEMLSGFYEEEDGNPLRDRLDVIDSVLETGSMQAAFLGEARVGPPLTMDDEETKNKKGASRRRHKYSPTPSDISVNSKENEGLPTNSDAVSKLAVHKQENALSKLTQQQRYSSEDLYKPRPVLSMKSKRRGLNSAFQ